MLIANKTQDAMQISVIGEIMGENDWTASDAAYLRVVLDAAEGAPLSLWVSSPGGSLDAAMTMRAMLAAYEGGIEIHTAGIVASAATLLLCVPQAHVVAERGSVFMVHTARMGAAGDAREMRKAADVLDACDDEIMNVYKLRLKCGDDELRDMMAAETWLRSSDAERLGLVDSIADMTSGGYVAEPRNPDPLPDAVSARLTPRIDAICSGISNLSAVGETRVTAINSAVEKAVSGIVDASDKTVAGIIDASDKTVSGIIDASEHASAVIAEELKAVRTELAEARAAYAESAKKYSALDAALSRVYALSGGDLGCALHDEQRFRDEFKLNV